MTADEIHDENLKEFVDAMGVCADAITVKPQLEFYSGVVWEYENEILPLRADADEGVGDYSVYDEAFNEMLEGLFEQVKTEAALLDVAPSLLKACKMLLRAWDEGEETQDVEWECLELAVTMAREAVAEAEKVPAS